MKRGRILSITSLVLFAGLAIMVACQKSASNSTTTTDTGTAVLTATATADDQSNAVYNSVFDNVMGVNDDAGIGTGIGVFSIHGPAQHGAITNGADSLLPCFTVTISPAERGVFPKTITIDFGTGCTGRDGRVRKGKIITVYSGRMLLAGSKATTTFDGFYVDSFKVEGTHTIENVSTSDKLVFQVTLQNGMLTAPSGNYVNINRARTWTQTVGTRTTLPIDDVFQITGTSEGTLQYSGTTWQWTTAITQPLVREFSCGWIVSGQLTITGATKTGVLDYGSGDCDNEATLTVGTKVYNITLR